MESGREQQSAYLSYLLDEITGTDEIVNIRKDYCRLLECMALSNETRIKIYFTGSAAEGLELPGSDKDYMIDINNSESIEVFESNQDLIQSTHANHFLIVTENVPPGFVKLKTVKRLRNDLLSRSLVNHGQSTYLSSQLVISSLREEYEDGITITKIQGPSIEMWGEYANLSQSGVDSVNSIHCNFWPKSADEWVDRPRKYGWPSTQDREKIVGFGCHLVPIGHPLSSSKSLEWRLSFSVAERTLVWSFNHTQMQCYAVMKLIVKEFVKVNCTEQHKGVLCSYFIKTFLFWQFEATYPLFWQTANLIECIAYLFQEFNSYIQEGVLRHYFMPRFNLLEIKLTRHAQIELLKHLRVVIKERVSILGQCASLSRVWSKYCQSVQTNDTDVQTQEILNHCMIYNDISTMKKITVIACLQTDIISPDIQDLRLTYENSLLKVDAAIEKQAYSTLPLLVIRRLCLLINIERLNCQSKGNKSIYRRVKVLDKNVFGTDIATSKLWLATFFLHQGDFHRSLHQITDVLSSIPPCALYYNGERKPAIDSTTLPYKDMYGHVTCSRRATQAWLVDIDFCPSFYPFMPRAIQIELDNFNPGLSVKISPFTYAYYLMFLCYHGLGQADRRDRALDEMADILKDDKRCCVLRYHSYNIVGHCLLMVGKVEDARVLFLLSTNLTHHANLTLDKFNAAYHYLSYL